MINQFAINLTCHYELSAPHNESDCDLLDGKRYRTSVYIWPSAFLLVSGIKFAVSFVLFFRMWIHHKYYSCQPPPPSKRHLATLIRKENFIHSTRVSYSCVDVFLHSPSMKNWVIKVMFFVIACFVIFYCFQSMKRKNNLRCTIVKDWKGKTSSFDYRANLLE